MPRRLIEIGWVRTDDDGLDLVWSHFHKNGKSIVYLSTGDVVRIPFAATKVVFLVQINEDSNVWIGAVDADHEVTLFNPVDGHMRPLTDEDLSVEYVYGGIEINGCMYYGLNFGTF